MSNVQQIDQELLSDLYDELHHYELGFVKHATYQMFHLFGSPLHNFWENENQAFGVYLVYYKLSRKYGKPIFIKSIQSGKVPQEQIFSLDEKKLVQDKSQLRHQAKRIHSFLSSLADEFDYEIWLIEVGLQVPYQK